MYFGTDLACEDYLQLVDTSPYRSHLAPGNVVLPLMKLEINLYPEYMTLTNNDNIFCQYFVNDLWTEHVA